MTDKVRYCTADDVRRLIGVAEGDVSDADANSLIDWAEEDVKVFCNTVFLKPQSSGTVVSATTDSLTDSAQSWTADEWNADADLKNGYMVYVYAGTGSGQARVITDNTDKVLSVSPDWTTALDTTSKFHIVENTYQNKTFSGDGSNNYYTENYPVVDLYSITIDSTDITVSGVYLTPEWGKIELAADSEVNVWRDSYPLLCNVVYFYGVYSFPKLIEEYCAVLAALNAGQFMVGSTFTFATSYQMPDLSVNKGVPYPHFEKVMNELKLKRAYMEEKLMRRYVKYAVG